MTNEPRKICFAIMPFESGFDDISRIIADSARECGLDYVGGDHRNQPGSIMPQIIHDIRHATVIVVDVSGENPNVFYELGIAHQIKGPGQVVLITRPEHKPVFDIIEFRQLRYEHTKKGRTELRKKLPACLREAMSSQTDREVWSIVRGALERTRLIVRDLRRLFPADPSADLKNVTIRMVSGLGSLAISRREPPDAELGPAYNDALIAECNLLRRALVRGAELRALLHPPRTFTRSMLEERLRFRYERLIGLLEGRRDIGENVKQAAMDLRAIKRCEFHITPVPMPHLLIVGNQVAYEGLKRGGSRGYAMTHCETDAKAIQALIDDFDRHFDECSTLTATSVVDQLTAFFREATKGE